MQETVIDAMIVLRCIFKEQYVTVREDSYGRRQVTFRTPQNREKDFYLLLIRKISWLDVGLLAVNKSVVREVRWR
jgi:hypothetical protein